MVMMMTEKIFHISIRACLEGHEQLSDVSCVRLSSTKWGYRGGSPTAVRPSDPALCGSCPLVTP